MNANIIRHRRRARLVAYIFCALQLVIATTASAQSYFCLPSCSATDGRFLSLSGSKYQSIAGDQIAIKLAAPTGSDSISFEIFDGETSGVWDLGTASLDFVLFSDPDGDGTGLQRLGRWSGSNMGDTVWHRIALRHDTSA